MHIEKLLILGGLSEFVPLVQLAKEHGIATLVIDGNKNAPAKLLADQFRDIDVRHIDEIAAVANAEGVTAITTAYSDLLLECMVKIAHAAGLPCHLTPEQLPYYRNKAVMRDVCAELAIPCPKSCLIYGGSTVEELNALSFLCVVKPLDSYGSRGVQILHSESDLRQYLEQESISCQKECVLVEEYNPDPEFNMQCWVRHGKVIVLGIADREKTAIGRSEIPISTRNVYPSRFSREVLPEAVSILQKYISVTGQTEGPLSMQFYWSRGNGISVGEIAGRFLGYEHELLLPSCNVSTEELLLAAALEPRRVSPPVVFSVAAKVSSTGKKDEEQSLPLLDSLLQEAHPYGKKHAAVVYFHGKDGVVFTQTTSFSEEIHSHLFLKQYFYEPGDRIGTPQIMPYVARFEMSAETREELDNLSQKLISGFDVKEKDGSSLLYRNVLPS